MKIKIKSIWPGIAWIFLSAVLFFIPGESLPAYDWLIKIHIDTWVHIVLFAIMVILWCKPFTYRPVQKPLNGLFLAIAMIFFGYGILVEVMQHFFIPSRSFDWTDIGADAFGCLTGFLYMQIQWKK